MYFSRFYTWVHPHPTPYHPSGSIVPSLMIAVQYHKCWVSLHLDVHEEGILVQYYHDWPRCHLLYHGLSFLHSSENESRTAGT